MCMRVCVCMCVCTVQTIPVAASGDGCHMEQHAEGAWLAGSGQSLILTTGLSCKMLFVGTFSLEHASVGCQRSSRFGDVHALRV